MVVTLESENYLNPFYMKILFKILNDLIISLKLVIFYSIFDFYILDISFKNLTNLTVL